MTLESRLYNAQQGTPEHQSGSLHFTDMKVTLLVTLLLGASSGWPMFPSMVGMWPPMQRVYNFFFLPFHYQPPTTSSTTITTTTTTTTISTTTTPMTTTTPYVDECGSTATCTTPTTSTTATTTTSPTTTSWLTPEIEVVVKNAIEKKPVSTAKVTVKDRENKTVADQVPVKEDGKALIELEHQGKHKVYVEADGFIDSEDEVDVQCNDDSCQETEVVAMSPELEPGQTRIIMEWNKENPTDIDLHVFGIRNQDGDTCRTYYAQPNNPDKDKLRHQNGIKGCPGTTQDVDNLEGGPKGPETITLNNTVVNKDYVYLIGIVDYNFAIKNTNDTAFLESGASVKILNERHKITRKLPENPEMVVTMESP